MYSIVGIHTNQIENIDAMNIQEASILSMNGQVVFKQCINQPTNFKLNISTLPTGVYILLLHLDNQKFHVQKIAME